MKNKSRSERGVARSEVKRERDMILCVYADILVEWAWAVAVCQEVRISMNLYFDFLAMSYGGGNQRWGLLSGRQGWLSSFSGWFGPILRIVNHGGSLQ